LTLDSPGAEIVCDKLNYALNNFGDATTITARPKHGRQASRCSRLELVSQFAAIDINFSGRWEWFLVPGG